MNTSVQNPAQPCPDITQELDLIYTCQELGGIAESSALYTTGLTRRIAETGKTLEQLTIAELLALSREYKAWLNDALGGE